MATKKTTTKRKRTPAAKRTTSSKRTTSRKRTTRRRSTKKPAEPKGYSLHIGLNEVSKKHYDGWDGALNACENDAKSMQKIAKKQGFTKSIRLLTRRATRANVEKAFTDLAKLAKPGDLILLSYSGHGGQVKDFDKDLEKDPEPDRLDETWCLYDGQFLDDEVYYFLSRFRAGVRVFATIDCCHSGTAVKSKSIQQNIKLDENFGRAKTKAMPLQVLTGTWMINKNAYKQIANARKLKGPRKEVKAAVIQISACQDDELARDGRVNSLFTQILLEVWKDGEFKGSHKKFHSEIYDNIPLGEPNYLNFGPKLGAFTRKSPFKI